MAKPSRRRERQATLSPEEQARMQTERTEREKALQKEFEEAKKQREKREELLTFLDIPHVSADVLRAQLVLDMLMDDDKFKVLAAKLRNKAFW